MFISTMYGACGGCETLSCCEQLGPSTVWRGREAPKVSGIWESEIPVTFRRKWEMEGWAY